MKLESRTKVSQETDQVPVPSSAGQVRGGGRLPHLMGILGSRTFVLTIAAVLLILYFQQSSDGLFITSTNASLLLRQTAVYALAASAVALLIIMGEIDLSIGSAAYLA